MIFSIIIILIIAAVAFFHYLQGFFSATISAVLTIIAAVLAFAYHETIVESFLRGRLGDQASAITLVMLFMLIYLILRVIFDKAIPGNVRVPATVEKVGGGIMGLIAGIFAAGVLAVAAQQMPFAPSIAQFARFETEDRDGNVPASRVGGQLQTAPVIDAMKEPTYAPGKQRGLLVPADEVLLNMIAHLSSETGALASNKPLKAIHPDYLVELFGQRTGMEVGAKHTFNTADAAVEVEGVYRIQSIPRVTEHEFKKVAGAARQLPSPFKAKPGSMLAVVRTVFTKEGADKDFHIRLGPGAVRVVVPPAPGADPGDWVNAYPVGTLQGADLLYANRIDDFLFINVKEGSKTVDFVFEVDEKAFATKTAAGGQQISPGVFLEVKRLARVPLDTGNLRAIKPSMAPLTEVGVMRKQLHLEGGVAPPVAGGALGTTGLADDAIALGQRLTGSWSGTAGGKTRTFLFRADATADYTIKTAVVNTTEVLSGTWKVLRSDGPDSLAIDTTMQSPGGKYLSGEVTIKFKAGGSQITFDDSSADNVTVTLSRQGPPSVITAKAAPTETAPPAAPAEAPPADAPPAAEAPADAAPPADNALKDRLVGAWSAGQTGEVIEKYQFTADGNYQLSSTSVAGQTQQGTGAWTIAPGDGPDAANITLVRPGKDPIVLKWTFAADNKATRTLSSGRTREFTKQ